MSKQEADKKKNVLLITDYDGTISFNGTNNPKHLKSFLEDVKNSYPDADIDIALCSGRPLSFLQGVAQFLGRNVRYITAETGGLTAKVNPETGDLDEVQILASESDVELIQNLQKVLEPKINELGLQFETGKIVGFTIKHIGAEKSPPSEEDMQKLASRIKLLVDNAKREGHVKEEDLARANWVLTPDSYDACPYAVDKANAIKHILRSASDEKTYDMVIFSGDSANDIPARDLLLSEEFQKEFNVQTRVIGPGNAKKEYRNIDDSPCKKIIIGEGNGLKGTGLAFRQAMREFGLLRTSFPSKIHNTGFPNHIIDDKSDR
ncbi:MAG: HAD hydrolase family protein [Ignavibacteriales bacterium]